MCKKSESEIEELIKNLPDHPTGLVSFMEKGDFHGVVGWEVIKGRMLSFPILDHRSCSAYHTRFSKHTEINWHDHGEGSEELIICLEGSINIIFEDGTQETLDPADKIIIKKGVKHMATIGNKPCEIVAMTIPKETNE